MLDFVRAVQGVPNDDVASFDSAGLSTRARLYKKLESKRRPLKDGAAPDTATPATDERSVDELLSFIEEVCMAKPRPIIMAQNLASASAHAKLPNDAGQTRLATARCNANAEIVCSPHVSFPSNAGKDSVVKKSKKKKKTKNKTGNVSSKALPRVRFD